MKRLLLAAVMACAAIGFAPVAQADRDTNFASHLHTFGIYGQRDYNAWIAKIACKRMHRGVDTDAYQSAEFIGDQLHLESTTEQAWQFLGAAIDFYCPENRPRLEAVAVGN
ncbi:DUF732 domain-containing protein [Mycolicibacterium thermoresistibile]